MTDRANSSNGDAVMQRVLGIGMEAMRLRQAHAHRRIEDYRDSDHVVAEAMHQARSWRFRDNPTFGLVADTPVTEPTRIGVTRPPLPEFDFDAFDAAKETFHDILDREPGAVDDALMVAIATYIERAS